MRAKLKMIKQEMWWRMHQPIPTQWKWFRYVVNGYFNYHAVPTNAHALHVFRHHSPTSGGACCGVAAKDRMTWHG
jgi:RNA-directed DNA polymerase